MADSTTSLLERPAESTGRRDAVAGAAASRAAAALAVDIQGLYFAYRRKPAVLQSVSLQVPQGRLVMILGASGSGKTTLLKVIKGLVAPRQGEVAVLGEPVRPRGLRGRLDPAVAYIPQQLGLVRSRTVMENVLTGALGQVATWRGLTGLYPRATVARARETLALLGVAHKEQEKVRSLSGGERQRVAIARALVQQPRILLADEFVSQLDPATTAETMSLVRGIAASGVTVIMTTHELDVVEQFGEWVVVLRDGRKQVDCAAHEVNIAGLAGVMKE